MALRFPHHLYVNELKDLYNAENQLLKALPEDGEGGLQSRRSRQRSRSTWK